MQIASGDSTLELKNGSRDDEVDNKITEITEDKVAEVPQSRARASRESMLKAGLLTTSGPRSALSPGEDEIVIDDETDAEDAPLPPSVVQVIKDILECLHALHLQSLYEMSSI